MSIVKKAPRVVSAVTALALGCAAGSVSAAEGEWDWSVALYGWLAGIDGKVSVNGRQVGELDMSFSDILDDLDMTVMIHGEGFRGEWGFFADYLYLDMSDKDTKNNATIDWDISNTIFDLAGVYRPSASLEGFEAFAGLRYFKLDMKLDVTGDSGTTPVRSDQSYTDFMVGARYTGLINENWFYRLRADASGGDTDGTWSLVGSAGYRFGEKLDKSVVFGYRHLEIDLEDDQGAATVGTDLKMTGPFVAFNFTF